MTRSRPRGFTVIELMIALTLVAILLGIAAPSLREGMMSIRITGQANDLMADLALARSEAAKRNLPVYLCASTNGTACTNTDWHQGWLIFADENLDGAKQSAELPLKSRAALEGTTNRLVMECPNTNPKLLPYFPTGVSTPGGAIFGLCDERDTANAGRTITINMTGRPVVTRATCSGGASSEVAVTCP